MKLPFPDQKITLNRAQEWSIFGASDRLLAYAASVAQHAGNWREMKRTKPMAQPQTLLDTMEDMATHAPEDGLSLREIMDTLDQSAFGALLIVLAMPVSIPLLYGIPQIVSVPMIALAGQMVMGRAEPWLPEKFGERRMSKTALTQISTGGRKWFGWVEKLARPRLQFLASKPAERVIGLLLCIFCASILLPLPLTNTVPGIAVAIVGFGLLAKDGLVIIPGLLLGTGWVIGLIIFGETLTRIIRDFVSGIF